MRKWFRSLRVRLQLWHAVILMMVVLGFGLVLHQEIIRSRWDDVDSQLLATARVLEGGLRKVPRPILDSLAQDINAPRRLPPPRRRRDGGPNDDPRGFPSGGPPLQWDGPQTGDQSVMEEWERDIQLPLALPANPGINELPPYFVIWRRDGSILRQQNLPYDNPLRPFPHEMDNHRRNFGTPDIGPLREIFIRGPEETLICVGRGVRGEVSRMWNMTGQLSLAGVGIMVCGLWGGWWLSRRAIAPITHMTETAAAIQPTNLSQRIDLSGVDLELAELGTMLNTMLSRLENAFQAQRRFTSDASHELRTPLAVLLSTIELTLSRPREPEEYRNQLHKCQRAAVRMQQLVQSLLTLSRADESAPTDRSQSVDLTALTKECMAELESLALERQVKLNQSLSQASVLGNQDELAQVITNLVTNAILYNKPSGTVTVTLDTPDTERGVVRLTVEDSGIGIPEKDLPELFKRFYRVDTARSRALGGNGLGLSICQSIVIAHGGTITATSRLDEGSQFVVTLPTSDRAAG